MRGPELPACVVYLWGWFLELHNARPSGGLGPGAISYSDIYAWTLLTGNRPTKWDVEVLKQLDYAYLSHVAKAATAERSKAKKDAPKQGKKSNKG